jgi:molecular chaperone GrpE
VSEKTSDVRVVDKRWWARQAAGDSSADATEPVALKPTYVEDLERRLADTTAQLQSALTERQRALEDFEQARTRIRRDVAREVERGKRAVLIELLDVVDNLDRAIAAAGEESESPLLRGVHLVRHQFLARLESFGVTRVPALGQPFDAARHEAIATAPVDDASKDGIVVGVVKEGYTIGDELLRPASVIVGTLTQ